MAFTNLVEAIDAEQRTTGQAAARIRLAQQRFEMMSEITPIAEAGERILQQHVAGCALRLMQQRRFLRGAPGERLDSQRQQVEFRCLQHVVHAGERRRGWRQCKALHHAAITIGRGVLTPQRGDDGGVVSAILLRAEQNDVGVPLATRDRRVRQRCYAPYFRSLNGTQPRQTADIYVADHHDGESVMAHGNPPSFVCWICLYNGRRWVAMSASSSPLSRNCSHRLTMRQNSSAVRSASYTAECASPWFHARPAAWAARASTVWPKARPPRVAVSKVLNGWKGLRLMPVRAAAALMKARSNEGLWPSRIARVQLASRTARRIG